MPPIPARCLIISFISMIILSNVISSSLIFTSRNLLSENSHCEFEEDNSQIHNLVIEIRLPKAISQDDNTTMETSIDTTTPTTETSNITETEEYPPWKPNINFFGNPIYFDPNMYFYFALIFSVLGILSTLWLIFFVETSKERTIRERIIGSAIRLILMSLFLGLALHFWILFEPI